MRFWKACSIIASIYAVCGIALGFFLQTKFLGNEIYATEGLGRPNPLQVRGAIVYVSDLEYYAFKIALYPSVAIIVIVVFAAILLNRKS